ncbi:MAG: hypothetical protein JW767_05455, partial [Thermoleophilia bacterium]|nr:hypothetical protein [Thermoleophilia bacterium]
MRRDESVFDLTTQYAAGRLTRRQFVARGLALGLSLTTLGALLGACGESEEEPVSGPSLPPMDETVPEEVSVFNWAEYLAPSVRKGFEEEYGITVRESYFDNNEAMLAKLRAGATGYDVIVPSSYMASILIKSGLVEPLDFDYLPNM